MSNSVNLDVLKQHQQALLLAEVVALLHDLGKLSSYFIDQMSRVPPPGIKDINFRHENAIEVPNFVDKQLLNVLKDARLCNLLRWKQIPSNKQIGQLSELILCHDKPKHSAFLIQLLNQCDGSDSGADKGTTRQEGLPKEAKQDYNNTFIATAFGYEAKLDVKWQDTARMKLSMSIGEQLGKVVSDPSMLCQIYPNILREIQEKYRNGLGETRRSANDVTLWDHSYSVATLYKSSLATKLLLGEHLDLSNLRWRILCINFDVLGLYAKAIKIADLVGYQRAMETACKLVKKLVEEEYPLGNEIYRDTTGIYFTFPDLDLPADLAHEIRRRVEEVDKELAPHISVEQGDGNTATEQLKGILAKAHNKAKEELTCPFDMSNLNVCWQALWQNLPEGNWEVCPVCHLRHKREDDETCKHCQDRRVSRLDEEKESATNNLDGRNRRS